MSAPERLSNWEFWIDVGGTFTDCIARTPDGSLLSHKLLSSSVTKGTIERRIEANCFCDSHRLKDPAGFWIGFQLQLIGDGVPASQTATVTAFDSQTGIISLDQPLIPLESPRQIHYELISPEEAPIVAIRYLMGLRLNQVIPPVSVHLGTTRGTNALLTRRGATTALITTRGFADVLLIGYQDRPELFNLSVKKPKPLFEHVVEIDERIGADGSVIQPPNPQTIVGQLSQLKDLGVDSIAICLMHAYAHPAHELLIEQIARQVGFSDISTSSRTAPSIKIVSRGDTTVIDAYLNPVLRAYLSRLQLALHHSKLFIMTSSGGLVDANQFQGKDSILSGPAGGVIGFSKVATEAGFEKSIGFDMGGTSTDVSRYDGNYDREFETEKAGVRVVAPMLAIETVAAGGGSICDFDGVKLTVGPDSAGAEPGPACYGRGGPLTVTDMNLFLGKIPTHRFPFSLDPQVVAQKLSELAERIVDEPDRQSMTPEQLAAGFLQIANANMVRAIRKVSIAKGYDPREHALVTFGGAGGQHACAIARSLEIQTILHHPFSGILSAMGIGMADVRRFAEHAVLRPISDNFATDLESLFEDLAQRAIEDVGRQGIEPSFIEPPIRSLDMRYQGTETTIHVSFFPPGNYVSRFEELHQQLFGFTRPKHAIEVVHARVEVVGKTTAVSQKRHALIPRTPSPTERTRTWFDDSWHETSVFFREDLSAGDLLNGPAIVCEPTSTVVIDPGFQAEVIERGELLIREIGESRKVTLPTTVDPIRLEIFNNLFASIAEQMGTTLIRTAISVNVKERRDFSCAVFSDSGDLVANAPHVPVHLGAMSETVKCVIADNPDMKAGDVYVTNDPYRGGSHLPDVTVVTPVFDPETNLRLFFTASRAHHAEIGGRVPGSFPPFSKNLAEEGVLIRNFKLLDGGISQETKLRDLLTESEYPSRSVSDNLADIAAQVAANQTGARLLCQLLIEHSQPVTLAYMNHIQDAAERKMRLELQAVPDGEYQWTDHLDDGSPISVNIKIEDDKANVDFSGTGPVISGNLNANRSIVTAAVLYVFRCMLEEAIPLNSGVLRPIEIVLPTCLLNPPRQETADQCAAVVGGNVETSSRVVDVLLGALGLAAASQGTMNNLTFGDETFGYYETIGGGSGATKDASGADAVHTHMTNTRLTDPEVMEHRYPVKILECGIRHGSGGTGQHAGGNGIIRRIEFLRALKVSLLTERRGPYPPFGLQGGSSGALGENSVCRAGSDQEVPLPAKVTIEVKPGDILTLRTPGGGGFGQAE